MSPDSIPTHDSNDDSRRRDDEIVHDRETQADVQPPAAPPDLCMAQAKEATNEERTDIPSPALSMTCTTPSVADTTPEFENSASDPANWKDAVRRNFETWLQEVDEIPETEEEIFSDPDLYSFFEQLAITNAEGRKANRRTAEAFSQWGETLERFDTELKFLRERLERFPARENENAPLSRKLCLALVELLDRLRRLAQAYVSPPKKRWLRLSDTAWMRAWENQRAAFNITLGHFETLLAQEGLTRIECLGRTFDPSVMAAVEAEPDMQQPDNTVLEEFAAGYYRHGELLRPAQVKVSVRRSQEKKP
ncbi:MAG: nucleotide exchange factor GrpE [Acidobacteriota bacterium]|jgi:molecular chaperone GrpE (heat shock protein)